MGMEIVQSCLDAGGGMPERREDAYEALGDLMVNDIHALSMRTLTPEEWSG